MENDFDKRYKRIEPKFVTLKNKKHMLFALEYLRTLNAVESYRAVNDTSGNINEKSSSVNASKWLAREDIQDYLDYLIYSELRIAQRVGLNPGRVVLELVKIAYEPGYKSPSVKLRALELIGRAMGFLEDGQMFDGLEEARQRQIEDYSIKMYEREYGSIGGDDNREK